MHTPVMLVEALRWLDVRPGGRYVDCTLGWGGHAAVIADRAGPTGLLIGIDRDPEALTAASARLSGQNCPFVPIQGNFADMKQLLSGVGVTGVDGVLFDLGVSSPQLDSDERGFSYWSDAELDMRMDPTQGESACDLIARLEARELAGMISIYGEERFARRIAGAIVRERERQPIRTGAQLARVVKGAIPAAARRSGPHPARRTFQALRILVNDELGSLERGLKAAVDRLALGGRLVVISFHSLEDRLVKRFFTHKAAPCACPPGLPICACGQVPELAVLTGAVLPGAEETAANPRARSAKLRAAERINVPAAFDWA